MLVELHLPKVFGRDLADLQIDQEEATRKEVVENEITMIDLIADMNRTLLADQCKAASQLQQELPQMANKPSLQISFLVGKRGNAHELQDRRTPDNVLRLRTTALHIT